MDNQPTPPIVQAKLLLYVEAVQKAQDRLTAFVNGVAAGLGHDGDAADVTFDPASGTYTVTPKGGEQRMPALPEPTPIRSAEGDLGETLTS